MAAQPLPVFSGKTKQYTCLELLETTSQSRIFRAETEDHTPVAVKVLDRDEYLLVPPEVKHLQAVKHPHILPLLDYVSDTEHHYLVFPLMESSLFNYFINRREVWSSRQMIRKLRGIVQAVAYLHSIHKVHGDIKPENILMNKDEELFLADFGFCRDIPKDCMLYINRGSPRYAAPEILQTSDNVDAKRVDAWALGATMYVCITGRNPWTDQKMTEIDLVKYRKYNEKDTLSVFTKSSRSSIRKLILPLVHYNPEDRTIPEDMVKVSPWAIKV